MPDPDATRVPGALDSDLTPAETPEAKALETPLSASDRAAIALERIAVAFERIATAAEAGLEVFQNLGPALENIPVRMGEANEHARSGVGG